MVELGRDSDKNDCAEIASYGDQVDAQDDHEEDDSKDWIICQTQQNELCHCSAVPIHQGIHGTL
jgi:hypothetical protein